MISIKPGVRLSKLKPQMVLATLIVHERYQSYGCNLTITSGEEGTHSEYSLHYDGYALDYRTSDVPVGYHKGLFEKIRWALGDQYDAVAEPTHLHVEFDPEED